MRAKVQYIYLRLRGRYCESLTEISRQEKKLPLIRCDQELHDKWRNGSKEDREGLLELLESCNWDKACDLGNLN